MLPGKSGASFTPYRPHALDHVVGRIQKDSVAAVLKYGLTPVRRKTSQFCLQPVHPNGTPFRVLAASRGEHKERFCPQIGAFPNLLRALYPGLAFT